MGRLEIRIDPGVYRLRDPKVQSMLAGRLSVEAFALLVSPGDPFMLVGDTIYALSEDEFYALHATLPRAAAADAVMRHMLSLEDLSFMSRADAAMVERARDDAPGCPACRLRRYRDDMVRLAKKYGVAVPDLPVDDMPVPEYPETDGEIPPQVTSLLSHMYSVPATVRRPCMDCVEKHVAQAWVLSNEARQGYPEHAAMVVGHLGEAVDELPKSLLALERTLVFCLARTNCFKVPFVPIGLIVPMLQAGRKELALDAEDPEDDASPSDGSLLQLDVDGTVADEMAALPPDVAADVAARCDMISKIIPGVENPWCQSAIEWEGAMGALADRLAPVAPAAANLVRNRRLVFRSDPRLMASAGMDMSDLAELRHGDDAGGAV